MIPRQRSATHVRAEVRDDPPVRPARRRTERVQLFRVRADVQQRPHHPGGAGHQPGGEGGLEWERRERRPGVRFRHLGAEDEQSHERGQPVRAPHLPGHPGKIGTGQRGLTDPAEPVVHTVNRVAVQRGPELLYTAVVEQCRRHRPIVAYARSLIGPREEQFPTVGETIGTCATHLHPTIRC